MKRFIVTEFESDSRNEIKNMKIYGIFDTTTKQPFIKLNFRSLRRAESVCNIINAEWEEYLQEPY